MGLIRKVVPLQMQESANGNTVATASTSQLARDGHVVLPSGLTTENLLRSGTILFDHDPQIPVGRPVGVSLAPDGSSLSIEVEWAPAGISAKADEVRGLVKAGIIRAVSIGFEPTDLEPLDPKKPKGGQCIKGADILELSFVSVPADTGAVVTQRAAEDWKCGASRDLPIEESDSWDGGAAEESIFEWAGGDDFDPSKARKGFLAYNAAKPKERGSYKLPIAHVVGGRLKVPKGAIRAAASRLPQADIPESVQKSAQAVIDHYKEKAGMASDRSSRVTQRRATDPDRRVILKRDFYKVARLSWILEDLGCLQKAVDWEEAMEEDENSTLPERLAETIKSLISDVIAMAQEEGDEMAKDLAGDDEDDEETSTEERSYIRAAKTPLARAWRAARIRAGKALSKANTAHLERAMKHHTRATKAHEELGSDQEEVASHIGAAQDAQAEAAGSLEKARSAHEQLGEALQAAKAEPDNANEHVTRAIKLHKQVAGHHDDVAEAHEDAAAAHESLDSSHGDAEDAHETTTRHLGGIGRCMRSVLEGSNSAASEEDGDSRVVQTSGGTAESTGASNGRSRDVRRRRDRKADLQRLAVIAATH